MTQRIRGFDGLRAIAVCLVFVQHNAHITLFGPGQLGVWAFFALSGFLITGILARYRQQIEAGAGNVTAALEHFLLRRTLRIFPIYYLLLALLTAMVLAGFLPAAYKPSLPFHYAYLSNFWIGAWGDWPGPFSHLWSLAVEEQFYLLFAPVLLLLPLRWHWLACTLLAASGAAAMWAFKAGGTSQVFFLTHPLTNMWVLALGALAWQGVGGPDAPLHRLLQGRAGAAIALLALILGVASSCYRAPDAWTDLGPLRYAASALVLGACLATLVAWIACRQDSLAVRLLEARPLAALGKISYGFYLYHLAVPLLLDSAWFHGALARLHLGPPGPDLRVALIFVLTLALARLSFVLIEAPFMRLGRAGTGLKEAEPEGLAFGAADQKP
jgi:peptidoglycan/LPS O-acetylase OafA/YrhL